MSNRPDINERPAAVLVIGGGVVGMRAAIDLAEAGLKAYLVESTPALGGRVAQLGFMFPTHDCVLCRGTSDHGYGCTRPSITPALLDYNLHPNIEVLTSTDVVACDGQAGDFTVHLRRQPQFVDAAKCINCGRCAEGGLGGAAWIDPARCQGCGTCTAECPAHAIELLGYRDDQILSGVGGWGIEAGARRSPEEAPCVSSVFNTGTARSGTWR